VDGIGVFQNNVRGAYDEYENSRGIGDFTVKFGEDDFAFATRSKAIDKKCAYKQLDEE